MSARIEAIKQRIDQSLAPTRLDLIDQSHAHAGHAGSAETGGGHFVALIVSTAFAGKSLLQRHRLVYDALGNLMRTDIHAFSIKAYTPEEFNQ